MNKVTFAVNTSKNEKPYIELLLQSMLNGIDVNIHDIMVFVDSDNQNTTERLVELKPLFPNLTIIKNTSPTPLGYQKNVNYMFSKAKTEIVSFIQSDMCIGLDYDKRLLSHLTDNMILCSTRVEPPLHCQHDNSITYVRNFGLTPEEFDYEGFLRFSEEVKNPTKLTSYFFAPFTLHKKLWNEIGGHDIRFLKSREDSDISTRFCLKGYNLIQAWDVFVYHFSCTSSRGIKWWTQENKDKETIRQQNDKIELDRFIKKWHTFMHPSSYQEVKPLLDKYPDIINNIIVNNPPIDESKLVYL